jgi:formate hydrogenlyase subunit 6/NADH:ubiquinone oxidoreductase subunit I
MKLYLQMTYFQNIKRGIQTTRKGLILTLKHLWEARKTKGPLNVQDDQYFKISEGFVTLQYPHETITVPEIGRYQLDCEIDDCIVCDKCAKICPVDCIEIEAIKSPELIRTTSDGSPVRLYAAKFDIDMAKCCFCGLCTTVCPTECLTMNSEYDYSVTDVNLLNFAFSNLSAQEADKKKELYEQFVAEKEAAKATKAVETTTVPQQGGFKPKMPSAFQPNAAPSTSTGENNLEATEKPVAKKPIFAPKKPIIEEKSQSEDKPKFVPISPTLAEEVNDVVEPIEPLKTTPKFVPKAKPLTSSPENGTDNNEANAGMPVKTTPKFVPKAKPALTSSEYILEIEESNAELPQKNIPKFVPKAKTATAESTISEETVETEVNKTFMPKTKSSVAEENNLSETPKPTLIFKPKMKPLKAEEEKTETPTEIKPKFIPKLKPKS